MTIPCSILNFADTECLGARAWVECANLSAKTAVMFFSVLNKNQALSVDPIEHFVKLHSQIYSLLKLRETYNVAKACYWSGFFPREFKEENLCLSHQRQGVQSRVSGFI